jgi:hypothetical protein
LAAPAWVADTQLQLQLSQLSYLDADADEDQLEDADEKNTSSTDALSDASDNEEARPSCQPGSQAQPLEISSNDESDGEPRRSGRVRRVTRIVESQLSQIEKGLIPAPGARAKVRALNAKKKQNTEESQLDHDFKLIE